MRNHMKIQMKKYSILLLTVVLMASMMPSFASTSKPVPSEALVLDTIKAMGIMSGDQNGNMRLNYLVTRAELAQMLVNASSEKEKLKTMRPTSLFSDVKSTFWATSAIKIAVEKGWMSGYLDGTFRPNQYVLLEEAASAVLKLLGHTPQMLKGVYPSTQLGIYKSLNLDLGVKKSAGTAINRSGVMYMLYNAMGFKTQTGALYGETLGYVMKDGVIDYSTLVMASTEGPYVLKTASLEGTGALKSAVVYRNGKLSTLSDIKPYDVYYVSENMNTVWAYSQKAIGLYTLALPQGTAPTSVTVAGNAYAVGTSEAAYKLSLKGAFAVGDTVALLLGMNGDVVDVISPSVLNEITYGVVTKIGSYSFKDASGAVVAGKSITVVGTDGVLSQFKIDKTNFSVGNIVSITHTASDSVVKLVSTTNSGINGKFDAAASLVGSYKLSPELEMIDVNYKGEFAEIYPSRLDGIVLYATDIRHYTVDALGRINRIILNNVTGDLLNYVVVTSVDESTTVIPSGNPMIPDTVVISGVYEYLSSGVPGFFRTSTKLLGISTGGAVLEVTDGAVSGLVNLGGVTLDSVGVLSAMSGNTSLTLAPDVQVYERINGEYYLVNLAKISDTNQYTLTGYRDGGYRAGGLVRLVVATKK